MPVLRTDRFITPQFVPPNAVGVRVGTNQYVFDTTEDFYAPDIAPHLGTNLLATPLVVNLKFAGMHYHAESPGIRYAIARNVDVPGCLWSSVQPSARGAFEWTALDAFVAGAAAAGRDIVMNLTSTPTWASARPSEPGHYANGGDAEPANVDDLRAFVRAVAMRYRTRSTPITAFEICNEPKFAGGGGVAEGNYFTGTPGALAQMARAVFQGAKSVDAGVLILSPAPTGLEYAWVAGDASGSDHLDRFLGASDGAGGSGRDWVDALAFHAYSHDNTNNVYALPQMVANVRAVMARHDLSGRAIWITETSAIAPPLSSYDARHQQAFIARTLLLALGCGVARVIWYAWDDPLGFARQPTVAAYWDQLTGELAGATLSLVNVLRNRQVAAIVDGKRWLV